MKLNEEDALLMNEMIHGLFGGDSDDISKVEPMKMLRGAIDVGEQLEDPQGYDIRGTILGWDYYNTGITGDALTERINQNKNVYQFCRAGSLINSPMWILGHPEFITFGQYACVVLVGFFFSATAMAPTERDELLEQILNTEADWERKIDSREQHVFTSIVKNLVHIQNTYRDLFK